jgi:hypothetical protein
MRKTKSRNAQEEAIRFALDVAKRWGVKAAVLQKDGEYRVQLDGIRCPGAALIGVTDSDGAFFTFLS